ncbi:predicted protein [Plenodomus lingam JN3]|uniref:Predicted protein n=1 Tax=Leptosphaeria maculans (strain JN3 / isolate v23.1.3 / race Av1-4-5-6-7-8) TaxID=985895 RepID=E5A0S8_LEPMJ|nr:predicted protein [Plenodomus lingam JN3]CBX97224.1 predicted protein [Plenodomus lingam JN3]
MAWSVQQYVVNYRDKQAKNRHPHRAQLSYTDTIPTLYIVRQVFKFLWLWAGLEIPMVLIRPHSRCHGFYKYLRSDLIVLSKYYLTGRSLYIPSITLFSCAVFATSQITPQKFRLQIIEVHGDFCRSMNACLVFASNSCCQNLRVSVRTVQALRLFDMPQRTITVIFHVNTDDCMVILLHYDIFCQVFLFELNRLLVACQSLHLLKAAPMRNVVSSPLMHSTQRDCNTQSKSLP